MATSAELIREENKELLLSRVNDIVFVDALAGFECRRCERTLIRHYVAHCGRYFCANCKRVLTLSKSNCPLPACKQPLGDIYLHNVEFERKLYDLRAHCPNQKHGCTFVGQLKDIGSHLRECRDTRERAVPVEMQGPSGLETLVRELSIKFDKSSAYVNEIKEETSKLDKSLKDIKTEVENNKVLRLERIVCLINKMDCFTLTENKCSFQPDFIWKIGKIKKKLKQTTFEITSDAFTWTGYPVKAQAKMEVKPDDQVWVSLCIKEINEGKDFNLKLIPYVYYVLRDRRGNGNTKHWSRSSTYAFTSPFSRSLTFQQLLTHKSWLLNKLYNVDDSIVIEVYVEPPSMAQMVHSYDGTLVWAIDHYRKRKELAEERLVDYHDSPYFYTAPNGYRVQVKMWLAGYGEFIGQGLTALISFLTGEFDAALSGSFPHTTTVTLFNRKDPRRNITKTVYKDVQTEKQYIVDMCCDKEIQNVIENGALFFEVTIKPKN